MGVFTGMSNPMRPVTLLPEFISDMSCQRCTMGTSWLDSDHNDSCGVVHDYDDDLFGTPSKLKGIEQKTVDWAFPSPSDPSTQGSGFGHCTGLFWAGSAQVCWTPVRWTMSCSLQRLYQVGGVGAVVEQCWPWKCTAMFSNAHKCIALLCIKWASVVVLQCWQLQCTNRCFPIDAHLCNVHQVDGDWGVLLLLLLRLCRIWKLVVALSSPPKLIIIAIFITFLNPHPWQNTDHFHRIFCGDPEWTFFGTVHVKGPYAKCCLLSSWSSSPSSSPSSTIWNVLC